MKKQQISRREFLRLTGMAAGATAMSACGATPAVPASQTTAPVAADTSPTAAPTVAPTVSSEATTLNLLNENWGDIYNKLMVNISDDFTKTNPAIAVKFNFDPDWQTKLTTLLAGGTPPEATIMRPGALAILARKDSLMALDSFVSEAGLTRNDFVVPIYDSSTYDGKLYAIPGGADYICMYYSKDVMRDVGLDPEKPPTTLDELLAQSEKILKKNANGDIERVGYNPSAGHFVNWAFIHGGKFYDEANKKITANDPANVAVLTRLADYMKLLDVNKLAAFNQRPGTFEAGNAFSTKQAAFFFDGFWTYEALDQHAKDIDYGVAYWPTIKGKGTPEERKNYAISGWMYAIPKDSKQADEAWKFIRYAFIDEAAKMGVLTLNGPCVKRALKPWEDGLKEAMGADNRMAPYLKVFTSTGEAATNFFPIITVQSYYNDELNRIFDLVMRGEATAQAGLDEVTKNVQAELDKSNA